MGLTKLARAISCKEQVYEKLKTAIINQVLKPGERLNERILAENLGISRTPLREALHRLESEGWIFTKPWKGTYVSNITEQDIEEVFQLRGTLEIMVIELITQQMNPEQLLRIDEIHQMQIRLGDEFKAGEFIEIDKSFHMYLAELTGNKRLIQILGNLSDMMQRLGITAIQTNERYRETLQEHTSIIDSLKTKDIIKAKQDMLYHVLKTRKTVYRHWKNESMHGIED
jgi:Transcriptional regulators